MVFGLIKLVLGFLLKIYLQWLMYSLAVFLVLVFICRAFGNRSKYTYYAKFIMVYYAVIMGVALLFPVFLLRPKDPANMKIVGWFMRKCSYIMDITWEIRNSEVIKKDGGGMVCLNHQSAIDILAMFQVWQLIKTVTAVCKKEMFYVLPFGPAAWLAGITFIDRKSAKASYKSLDACAETMRNQKAKIFIYPEGTRNTKRGLLPFKRGAFKTAINAQAPVYPIVVSPYYFIDQVNKRFDRGHVIFSCLEPIPTVGLTAENSDELMDKARNAMLAEYEKIEKEVDENSLKKEWSDMSRPRMTQAQKRD